MRKILAVSLIVSLILICVMLSFLNQKMNVLHAKYNNLSEAMQSCFSTSKHSGEEQVTSVPTEDAPSVHTDSITKESHIATNPLTIEEAELFIHNIAQLKTHFGEVSDRPAEIANHCLELSRSKKMESPAIVSVKEYSAPKNAYCVEIVTDDGQQYWFTFKTGTRLLYTIHKGKDQEVLLYINVLAQGIYVARGDGSPVS